MSAAQRSFPGPHAPRRRFWDPRHARWDRPGLDFGGRNLVMLRCSRVGHAAVAALLFFAAVGCNSVLGIEEGSPVPSAPPACSIRTAPTSTTCAISACVAVLVRRTRIVSLVRAVSRPPPQQPVSPQRAPRARHRRRVLGEPPASPANAARPAKRTREPRALPTVVRCG